MIAYLVRSDARAIPLRDESVDCCVTSPPYWGLRDYGTARWEGGDSTCDHSPDARGGRFATQVSNKQRSNIGSGTISNRECPCGATRIDAQLGLERTPEEYVANMVAVFREVRRVLKERGTLWLNLGDSYAAAGYSNHNNTGGAQRSEGGKQRHTIGSGLKPKNLVGIPWRVAFALQADGWWLRSDIIWAKPNPMPESVTDRPTKAHEYVFLMAKSERYWYDAEAIAEDAIHHRRTGKLKRQMVGQTRNARTVWTIATQPYSGAHFATFPEELARRCIRAGCPLGGMVLDPFGGSGTVGRVAIEEGRRAVLCDIAYQELAAARISEVQMPLM